MEQSINIISCAVKHDLNNEALSDLKDLIKANKQIINNLINKFPNKFDDLKKIILEFELIVENKK